MPDRQPQYDFWRFSIALLVASISLPASAAIQSIGDVSPDPATATSATDLTLANTSHGTMQIDGGSDVVSRDGYFGHSAGFQGTAFVAGENSSWTHRYLYLGEYGTGGLHVAGGADVVTNFDAYRSYRSGSVGNSSVGETGSTWTVGHSLILGYRGNSNLELYRGGSVTAHDVVLGEIAGSEGKIVLSHDNSHLTATGYIVVGRSGKGTLQINPGTQVNGGHVAVGLYNADSRIAFSQGTLNAITLRAAADHLLGFGYITTHGLISDVDLVFDQAHPLHQQLLIDRLPDQYIYIDLDVNGTGAMGAGVRGSGSLRVAEGVVVNSTFGYVGDNTGSNGVVTIDGPGSSWNNIDGIYLGNRGNGIVHVKNQAKLTIGTPAAAASAYVGVTAGGNGTLNISSGGTVEVYGDIELARDNVSSGAINLSGGALKLHGGSILRSSSATASVTFTGGRLEGVGKIDMGTPFVQSGGVLVPGNPIGPTTIARGYTLNAGTIEFEINGYGSSTLQDSLTVTGAVNLLGDNGVADGVLDVKLNFAPAVNNQFLVIFSTGTDAVVGQFANGNSVRALFDDRIYQFSINYAASSGNDVVLTTQSSYVVGDFNSDGSVDAADYVVWRKSNSTSGARYFGADGNGNGVVDDADLALWRSHFGRTTGGGSEAGNGFAAIPEPSTGMLLALLLVACGPTTRQRHVFRAPRDKGASSLKTSWSR